MSMKRPASRLLNAETRATAIGFLRSQPGLLSQQIISELEAGYDVLACSHSIDPLHYICPELFRRDFYAVSLLSKFRVANKSEEKLRQDRAVGKFLACEEQLRGVQKRLQDSDSDESDVGAALRFAREKIRVWLGPIKDAFNVDSCSFGPGSSSSIPRSKAHPSRKFLATDVSSSCVPFLNWFFQDAKMTRPLLNLVEHSAVTYVPKNFKIDRIIAVEPDWNIFFQKGVGNALRRRLLENGLDLNNGAAVHQQLCLEASLFRELATIDFSSASDTICTALVKYLLPEDWYVVLNSMRTTAVKLNDVVIPLRKFSSMGNGFTFELESLIFHALATAARHGSAARGKVSTFGDDVVLPVAAVGLFTQLAEYCGFSLNKEKSFASGGFRESCGAYFFDGSYVKPIYLKENITHDSERFKFANAVRNLALSAYCIDVSDSCLRDVYFSCRKSIRRVFYIPSGYGDGGLVSRYDEIPSAAICGSTKHRLVRKLGSCIEGYKVKCLLPIANQAKDETYGMLIHKLRGTALKRRSEWHSSGLPIFVARRSDLFKADTRPETGEQFMTSIKKLAYRVSHMSVLRWVDPEVSSY